MDSSIVNTPANIYERLGVRPFINGSGTISALGGSIMRPEVAKVMIEASSQFVHWRELQEKAGRRIAEMTGAEGAFISAGAAAGMLLAGAACIAGTDEDAILSLPETGQRPNEFVISFVDPHLYIHQGFRACGGKLVAAGTEESVTPRDYDRAVTDKTAALVFFLGVQPREQLPDVIAVGRRHGIPVIVDAAAQLPPRSNLTDLTKLGASLVVFSGGKALCAPEATGLILGKKELIEACAVNGHPNFAIGRGMKVGKEAIAGLLRAVELFMEQDEEALLRDWRRQADLISEAVESTPGVTTDYHTPYTDIELPASGTLYVYFSEESGFDGHQVREALASGDPPIEVPSTSTEIRIYLQTLQPNEAEVVANRLKSVLENG